jgi:phenylalanyl-tRNA synthetase alpha chain
MITYEIHTTFDHALLPEGSQIAAKGSHEALVWAALPMKGQGEPMGIPELKVCCSRCIEGFENFR